MAKAERKDKHAVHGAHAAPGGVHSAGDDKPEEAPERLQPPSREMLKLDRRIKIRVFTAALVVIAACFLVVGSAFSAGIVGQRTPVAVPETEELTTKGFLEMLVRADGWDAGSSTPAVLCVRHEDGSPVLFHAIAVDSRESIELDAGTYWTSFISPVNAGGSIYRMPEPQQVTVEVGHTVSIGADLEWVAPDAATRDDYLAITGAVQEAVGAGDATLQGEAGEGLLALMWQNVESSASYWDDGYTWELPYDDAYNETWEPAYDPYAVYDGTNDGEYADAVEDSDGESDGESDAAGESESSEGEDEPEDGASGSSADDGSEEADESPDADAGEGSGAQDDDATISSSAD